MRLSKRESNHMDQTLASNYSTISCTSQSKFSEVETKKSALIKAAKGISINHIYNLPGLIQKSRKYELICRNFAMVINSFRESGQRVPSELLSSGYSVADFIFKNSSGLLTEILTISNKINKGKYWMEDIKTVYDNYPLPQDLSKKCPSDIKVILNYLLKLYALIFEVAKSANSKYTKLQDKS